MKVNRAKRAERAEETSPASRRAPQPGHPGDGDLDGDAVLDHRKAAILNAVVAEYIETAQPVGSAHITGNPGVEVSSATVRSEMAALERDGYLAQPHTSAGRIPTDKGYRFFVDHLGRPGTLGPHERHEVRKFFAESNPWALRSIAERLLEADQRDLWDASAPARRALVDALLEAEGWEEGR